MRIYYAHEQCVHCSALKTMAMSQVLPLTEREITYMYKKT